MNLPFEGYLRRKDSYEAADAGLLLWRENFAWFLLFFALPFCICAFALRMLPGRAQYLSWLVLWYLKPLFDRPVLHIISVRFFEPEADIKRLLKGFGKSLRRALLGDLLWRRFSPFRAAAMPMRVLEPGKNNGKIYTERKKLLNKGGLGYCFLLSFWGVALEIALFTGEMLFLLMMGRFLGLEIDLYADNFMVKAEKVFFAAWCINYIIVETIYICMGFALYINSRIEVEGWDIEIIFRGFAEKLKKKKMLGALAVFCLLLVFAPLQAYSDDTEVPLEKLQEILSSPDFGYEIDSWSIRLKNPPEQEEQITVINYNRNNFIEWLAHIFASGLRILVIAFIAAAAITVFIFSLRNYKKKNTTAEEKTFVSVIHGIPQKNPQELLEKALEFFKQGELRNAWGYCTAAAILSLQLYRGLIFPPNATENDCANIANAKLDKKAEAQSFYELIKTWVNFVYAGHIPPNEKFEDASAFCRLLATENEAANG